MKRAVVVGSEGQDGRLLFDRLTADAWEVTGIGRDASRRSTGEPVDSLDILDRQSVADLTSSIAPDAVYYLAAVHQSSEDAARRDDVELFNLSHDVHVRGAANFLDALARVGSGSFFYSASSLVFGDPVSDVQDESTPFAPASPYAITKAAGIHVCRYFRETHNVNASAGILYNHESPLRKAGFVSQKIVRSAVRIADGRGEPLVLGSLDSLIDWGYAPDFVDAMIRVACLPSGDDYVVATGEAHSVGEFAELAFARVGLDWRDHVSEDRSVLTRKNSTRIGNATRVRERTGWKPTVSFAEMVGILVDARQAEEKCFER